MSKQTIGDQLDALGLATDIMDGGKVSKAEVEVTIEYPNVLELVPKMVVPAKPAGEIPVPHPVETRTVTVTGAAQNISTEQRDRICAWLKANGINPKLVAIGYPVNVEYRTNSDRTRQSMGHIHFTQYYVDESGSRIADHHKKEAVTLSRCVPERILLEPEPAKDSDA
ncbi:hypothetical protein [Streptomyces lydicus]|uniref:hypothetical protein n=1 Tax=Streptomyces lydicus TaxID=47763 RepID=UPI0037988555